MFLFVFQLQDIEGQKGCVYQSSKSHLSQQSRQSKSFLHLNWNISHVSWLFEIMSCLFSTCRVKSRPFMVMPGLQMTLNPPLRLTVKSTLHLISSSPLEGSHLFWVTLRYQVRQNHRYLWRIFITWMSVIQNLLAGDFRGEFGYYQWWFFRIGNSSKVRLEYNLSLFNRVESLILFWNIFSSHQTQCGSWCGLHCSGDGRHSFHSRI